MKKHLRWMLVVCLIVPMAAMAQTDLATEIATADAAIREAEAVGAAIYATSLYDEARARLSSARQNAEHRTRDVRESARLDALEAMFAADAAEAKALWVARAREANDLRTEIINFGDPAPAELFVEDPALPLDRGNTTASRIAFAESVVAVAMDAGASAMNAENMQKAQDYLVSAKGIARSQRESETAEYLAYAAEMMAREAYYETRLADVTGVLPGLRLERARLAEQIRQREAAAERQRREQIETEAARLRSQLEAERQGRQMREAELQALRLQLEENQQRLEQQLESDRQTRIEAEQRLFDLGRQYEAALAARVDSVEAERLRRQIEDQQLALQAITERVRMSEQMMQKEIERLRADLDAERRGGSTNLTLLDQREEELDTQLRELDAMRRDREIAEQRRREVEAALEARIAEAETRTRQAEQQQAALQQQVEAERARAAQAEAELARIREEAARKEAEQRQRIEQMETSLAEIAETRRDERGFIVTLPGIYFDTGKAQIKAGARENLSRIAEQLRRNESVLVVVEGHTDSTGSDQLNQRLSEQRARAVRDFLVTQGLAAERISTVGKGEGSPIASNDTAAGRQQNRRVELVLRQR